MMVPTSSVVDVMVRIPSRILVLIIVLLSFGQASLHAQIPAGFVDQVVLSNLSDPVGCTWDANGRMYIWEKRGMVRLYENGVLAATPLLDIREEVGNWRDHGMLGFALDPNFLSNGRVYVMYAVDRHHLMNFGTPSYNATTDTYYQATIMRITRYTAVGPTKSTVDPASRTVLLGESASTGVPLLHESHSTGQLVFGTDGTLLATFGDGASYNLVDAGSANGTYWAQALADGIIRPEENVGAFRSQMLQSLNGKLVRLDPNTGDGVPSNPFYDPAAPRSPKSRTWALGLRNPYRFTLRPGSGSTNPADGDPGSFYIGDVGWGTWEDLNVCYEPAMNFGWPLYEGMDPHSGYQNALTANQDAPNPLYDGVNCAAPFFNFQDLLIQETQVHPTPLPNPCDPNVMIATNNTRRFIHARPAIDYRHGNQSRCSSFNGTTPVVYDLQDPSSPVPGPQFGGYASVGGTWFTGTNFPSGYQNVYFHADYAGGWIRKLEFDANDNAVSVSNFATNLAALTFIGAGPDGALYYMAYNQNSLHRIVYGSTVNLAPVAVASQNLVFGPGPLSVQFTGSNSTDPENATLTYFWNFGNGNTSTQADPTHVFTAPPNTPTTYTVTLTVTDPGGLTNSTQLIVSVNNTPPNVTITSPVNNAFYTAGITTVLPLTANVSDAEHAANQLTYAWQTILHHNTHIHKDPVDNDVVTSTMITGEGCDGDQYAYEIRLTVTDAVGLSTTVSNWIHPDCAAIGPTAYMTSTNNVGQGPLLVSFSGSLSFDPGTIVSYVWDYGDGTTGSGVSSTHTYTSEGEYTVTLTCTDDDGMVGTATGSVVVYTLGIPQCVGAPGTITRQWWTGIAGGAVSDLTTNAAFPDNPTGTNQQTTYSGPVNFNNNYGTFMRGYIIPPQTGMYRFTITSDDASQFFLSLNQEVRFKRLVASISGWTQQTEFTKYASQRSVWIQLEGGKHYYTEMLHKEGGGDDHLQVYWEGPGFGAPTLIAGQYLAPWVDCPPSVKLKTNLQGPFRAQAGLMHDSLRVQGLIPLTEPYTALGFQHVGGGGGETMPSAMLLTSGNNAIVDWVLIELRNKNNPALLVATKSALLQRDGDIVDVSGNRRLLFQVPADGYFVSVRHRNHLGVMSASAIVLSEDEVVLDLTLSTTATYGTDARIVLSNGERGQWSGNVVNDGALKYTGAANDRDPMLQQLGGLIPTLVVPGYLSTDASMDGKTRYTGNGNDRDLLLQNLGGVVPTVIRVEQLP